MAGSPIKLLENLADYCALKNKVISKNIANIGTENYQKETVEFKEVFNQSMNSSVKTTKAGHIGNSQTGESNNFEIKVDDSGEGISGINNVNIDEEMSELAKNTLMFKFATKKIGGYYKNIQDVIRGGS